MKRRLFFVATALLSATTAFATAQSDTLIVKNPSEVSIINTDSACVISIKGKEGNPDFAYRQVIPIGKTTPVIINESETEWNFKMPFFSSNKSQTSKSNNGNSCCSYIVGTS